MKIIRNEENMKERGLSRIRICLCSISVTTIDGIVNGV